MPATCGVLFASSVKPTDRRELTEGKSAPADKFNNPVCQVLILNRQYVHTSKLLNILIVILIYNEAKPLIILGFIFLMNYSCGQTINKDNNQNSMYEYTNELIHESSPYLLQHAHNPVNWYPWGEKALKKAKEENKMLIISIGYSACHWCHVMEHESYEDTTVARIMNEHFVGMKVDREERPDVDQVYMNAAYLVTGSGGWPLNVLALPDGKPFFAGTYFPKDKWIKVLDYFIDIRQKDPESLVDQADNITQGIKSIENIDLIKEVTILSEKNLDEAFKNLKPQIDFIKGGRKLPPKFPMPSNWEYLMHYYSMRNDQDALNAVTSTLDNMAYGGIYDQIGGGFARYSTDENWHIPHFEKMLYDNAQLVSLYSYAWQITKKDLYKAIVYQTLEFIRQELTSSDGGFYSSLDADSEGEEGKFYSWSFEEVQSILKNEAPLFIAYYNITESGNWEHGKNVLFRKQDEKDIAEKYNLSLSELRKKIANDKAAILETRNQRVKPGLDDKILTSWNALMLKGYTDAYRVFGDEKFLNTALNSANFLSLNAIGRDNEIFRNYKNGKSTIPGLLDDYSFVISAFIDLYQATFDEKWLYKANELTDYAFNHFFDHVSGMFYYTHEKHSELIARKMEITDNVIPSSNSEMAKNLFLLGHYFNNDLYIQQAKQMLINVKTDLSKNISYYSNWAILAIHFIQPLYEVAIIGKDWNRIRKDLDNNYLPDAIFLGEMMRVA
ncbi:MAG TPA: thioredoxin domain-containing protein [Bacteroidales bacterium]|nr:thioredoxin domain-containing protein [Bacteroidales bacterium]